MNLYIISICLTIISGDQPEDERSPTSLFGSPTLGSSRGSSGIGPLRSSSPAGAASRLSSRPRLSRHRLDQVIALAYNLYARPLQ